MGVASWTWFPRPWSVCKGQDTHVSQALFTITVVVVMLKDDSQLIRVANATVLPSPPDGIPMEATLVSDRTTKVQDVLEVLVEVMEQKDLGDGLLDHGDSMYVAKSEVEDTQYRPLCERLCCSRTRAEDDL